jgi:hypothetical protein
MLRAMAGTEQHGRPAALARLDDFLGEWSMEAIFDPGESTGVVGRVSFAWALDGRFLVQRAENPADGPPSSTALIGAGPHGTYTQHYFDSRGVARVYAMTYEDGVWTLVRDTPDFTPLSFSQRFEGIVDREAGRIRGAWETSRDGTSWTHDFDLLYTRLR